MAVVIDWGPAGNCPVQAEGTFDGVPFYFRARGSSVTVDVGGKGEGDWVWVGPEYEWPEAGYISTETALAFINEAYYAWLGRNTPRSATTAEYKRSNDLRGRAMTYAMVAFEIDRAIGTEAAKPAFDWLMAESVRLNQEARIRYSEGVADPGVEPTLPEGTDLGPSGESEVTP